jgi:hypothetical protein
MKQKLASILNAIFMFKIIANAEHRIDLEKKYNKDGNYRNRSATKKNAWHNHSPTGTKLARQAKAHACTLRGRVANGY